MTSLIIKSKIWNKCTSSINYKEKSCIKQKITLEKTGIIYRKEDKIFYKQVDNLNDKSNSNMHINYKNETKNTELISIEKTEYDPNFYIHCGNWSKDLNQLIDQNAVYFLYKGLTIENFLKEKQKYYVLNMGDIIKLGKIYLKILHIELNESNKNEEKIDNFNDKKDASHKKIVSESDSRNDVNDRKNNNENSFKNNIKKDEEERSEVNKRNYTSLNQIENSENIEIFNKNRKEKNKNMRYFKLSSSLNRNLSDMNLDKKEIRKIGIRRSISFKLNILKNLSIRQTPFDKKNNHYIPKDPKNNKILNKIFSTKNISKLEQEPKPEQSYIDKENQKKGKICRICLSGEEDSEKNPLICPCICKGSMKYIHYYCLKNWLNLKIESELGFGSDTETQQPTITYSTNDISCELCKTQLPDYIKHKGNIYNVSFYKPKYNKFIVLESIRDDDRRVKFIHIIPLNKKQIVKIGRLNNCDLSLPDFSISKLHCCIYIEKEQLFLENNSKYGTKVLVQTPKLIMSPEYPLSIEVQETYLKISIQKPFSLFGCCNVHTTSVSKMLVYQKQNKEGFDLFSSMIFKDDNDENDDDIENVNNNEENICNKNNIKNNIDNTKDDNNKDINNNCKNNINYIVNKYKEKEAEKKININIIDNSNIEIKKSNNLKDKGFYNREEGKEELINDENNNKNEGEKTELIDNITNNNDDKLFRNKEKELIDDDHEFKFNEDKNSLNILQNVKMDLIDKDINKNNLNTENNQTNKIKNENKTSIDSDIKENIKRIKENKDDINRNKDKKSNTNSVEFNKKKEVIKKEENNKENNYNKINNIETEEKPKEKNEKAKIQYEIDKIEKEKKRKNSSSQNNENENYFKLGTKNNNIKRKTPKQIIDLNAINELSYKNSPLDNYQSIFGLMPNSQNDNEHLLAPKNTKNNNFKKFDFNINK